MAKSYPQTSNRKPPRRLRDPNDVTKIPPGLSGQVERTLSADGSGDFATLDELIEWLDTTVFSPSASLRLRIMEGTYEPVTEAVVLHAGLGYIWFDGYGGDIDFYGITFSTPRLRFDDLTMTGIAFKNQYVEMSNVEINGYTSFSGGVADIASTQINSSSFYGALGFFNGATGDLNNVDMVGVDTFQSKGINAFGPGSYIHCFGTCSITDFSYGIYAAFGSMVVYEGTFVSCGTEANVPINELQNDGALILDNTTNQIVPDTPPLTGTLSRSIGSTGDFATFDDFDTWLQTTSFYHVHLNITLQGQLHSVSDTLKLSGTNGITSYFINCATGCIVEMAESMDYVIFCTDADVHIRGGTWREENLFYTAYGFGVHRGKLKFSMTSVPLVITGFYVGIELWDDSVVEVVGSLSNASIDMDDSYGDADAIDFYGNNNSFYAYNTSILGNGVSYDALYVNGFNNYIELRGATSLDGWDTGIDLLETTGQRIINKGTVLNNTTDYTIPVNEIQYDGSYISTDSVALTLKA